jgi:predicted dehydrogenase/threonine dehydrogenase-like Zn-dependent dehydrogenase
MLLEFGKGGIVSKVRQQPDKVRLVLQKAAHEGVLKTWQSVQAKLDEHIPLGYANVGVVEEIGCDIVEFKVGDRLVSNSSHAEMVLVGRNMGAVVPDNVSDLSAGFCVPAAISLQGVRLAGPTLGETFVVYGLGLLGVLAVQILRANGCRVIGVDIDKAKLEMAAEFGVIPLEATHGADLAQEVTELTSGRGADGVLIAASASGDDIAHNAAQMCRKNGRVVLIGVVDLNLRRDDFYEKELTFQVSCSYGPGRYDPRYEAQGQDYPPGYVRWTMQRNFQAVLQLMSEGKISVDRLVSEEFEFSEVERAYQRLLEDRSILSISLKYPPDEVKAKRLIAFPSASRTGSETGSVTIGAVGAGNFASRELLPKFAQAGARLKTIVSKQGISGARVGKALGFEVNSTDFDALLNDHEIDAVVIATRHDTHFNFVSRALEAGKHVFVEKPLCVTSRELTELSALCQELVSKDRMPLMMVGFNRRFAPVITAMQELASRSTLPVAIDVLCNAGHIDASSWVQDVEAGGGRIVGEACHFIDLARFFAGSEIESIHASGMPAAAEKGLPDTAAISVKFANGSVASVSYFANGSRAYHKESIRVFQGGAMYETTDYRRLSVYGKSRKVRRFGAVDKGYQACIEAFLRAASGNSAAPIPLDELLSVSGATIEAAQLARA